MLSLTGFASGQSENNQNSTKIKFKYIPTPAYTKEARKRKITGSVYLRVEFKADGNIGEIEEIADKNDEKMRTYGLIDQAIKAARSIEFSPATEDGKAVTQKKIVVMEFRMF